MHVLFRFAVFNDIKFLVNLAHVHSRWHETMTRWSADPPDMWARVTDTRDGWLLLVK